MTEVRFELPFKPIKWKPLLSNFDKPIKKIIKELYKQTELQIIQILKKKGLYQKALRHPEDFHYIFPPTTSRILYYKNTPILEITPVTWVCLDDYKCYPQINVSEVHEWQTSIIDSRFPRKPK